MEGCLNERMRERALVCRERERADNRQRRRWVPVTPQRPIHSRRLVFARGALTFFFFFLFNFKIYQTSK